MKIIKIENNQIVFKYSDDKEDFCNLCYDLNNIKNVKNGLCNKNNYLFIKYVSSDSFIIICYDDIKTNKQAVFLSKLIINFLEKSNNIISFNNENYKDIYTIAVHNTRNIHAQINSKLLKLFNEKKLLESPNKYDYIKDIVTNNISTTSRELLSILKGMTQIQYEYNIIDYLKQDIRLDKSEFSNIKIHTVIVLAFYVYEQEFNDLNIKVNIQTINEKVNINFNTIKSVFTQLFDNCIKYCAPNITVDINFDNKENEIIIKFSMVSLFLTENDILHIFDMGFRGENTGVHNSKGDGLGMFATKKLVELNNGKIYIKNLSKDKPIIINDKKYSNNIFYIKLNKNNFLHDR